MTDTPDHLRLDANGRPPGYDLSPLLVAAAAVAGPVAFEAFVLLQAVAFVAGP